jgi:hypothetical protein
MAIQSKISYDGVGPAGAGFFNSAERILRQMPADTPDQEDIIYEHGYKRTHETRVSVL